MKKKVINVFLKRLLKNYYEARYIGLIQDNKKLDQMKKNYIIFNHFKYRMISGLSKSEFEKLLKCQNIKNEENKIIYDCGDFLFILNK